LRQEFWNAVPVAGMLVLWRSALVITAGVLPGQMYGAFFGGMLGYHFNDRAGGIIGAIVFFIIGRLVGERVARYLCNNR
jgi:hypothetical protein